MANWKVVCRLRGRGPFEEIISASSSSDAKQQIESKFGKDVEIDRVDEVWSVLPA